MVGDDLIRLGLGAQHNLLLNVYRDPKKNPRGFELWETFPGFEKPRKKSTSRASQRQTPEEQAAIMEALFASLGGPANA